METTQIHTNTTESVRKNADRYLSKVSTDLLNSYRFDKPYKVNTPKYLIVNAMAFLLCSDLDCDFHFSDKRLETMNMYIEKRDK